MANNSVRNLPGSLGFAPVLGMYESTHPRLSKGIGKKHYPLSQRHGKTTLDLLIPIYSPGNH
jgi:hypothetical protein